MNKQTHSVSYFGWDMMNSQNNLFLSFDDIFGKSQDDVSMRRMEHILEEVLQQTFENASASPHEFVHVVTHDGIQWMTTAQAQALIQSNEENKNSELQKSIQIAMQGSSKLLAQEHKILFLIAQNTLNRYRLKQLIPLEEVQRCEPNVLRLGRTVCSLLDKLIEVEIRIKEIRETHPVLKEFEQKMGLFLTHQKNGDQQEAQKLAQDLSTLKKRYFVASRGLSSDSNQSMVLRRDLQNQKKSILSWQRYLAAQRAGQLQSTLQDDRRMIENLQVVFSKSSLDKQLEYNKLLEQKKLSYNSGQLELGAVQHEQVLLEQKEKETEAVIEHLHEEITGETKSKPVSHDKRKDTPQVVPERKEKQPASARMVIMERQKSEKE